MKDLSFDGINVTWITNGNTAYKASSGLPGEQKASSQNKKDAGPIPEGKYSFKLKEDPDIYADAYFKTCDLKRSTLLQKIPRGDLAIIPNSDRPKDPITGRALITSCETYWANWGNNRIALIPLKGTNTHHRNGFYLHDSQKYFSHGCIELEPRFFTDLRSFMKKNNGKTLILEVKYPSKDAVTSWHLKK